jgi:hypothetical protein
MKRSCLLALVFLWASADTTAAPVSFAEAWRYVSAEGKSDRWIVVQSPKKDGYFQCENLDDVVRCVVPVWTQEIPTRTQKVLPVGGREEPYPQIPGSTRHDYMNDPTMDQTKRLFAKYGLDPFFVYSQVKDEELRVVGTQCDLRVMLGFDFKRFEALAKDYLKEVYGVTEEDGYGFDSDR